MCINQKLPLAREAFQGKDFSKEHKQSIISFLNKAPTLSFCTVGEEWGFLGSLILIGLFSNLNGQDNLAS